MGRLLIASAAAAVGTQAARGAVLTYDADTTAPANDGAGVWDTTTANWYNGTADVVWPNTTGDTAIFGVGGTAGTVNVAAVNAGTIQFNPVAGSYNLTGGTINLGGAATIFADAGVTPTIASTITGTALNKTGTGTLTLTGSDTFNGIAAVSSGGLALGGNATDTFASEIAIGNGASPAGVTAAAPNVAVLTIASGTTVNAGGNNVGLGNGDNAANQSLVANINGTLNCGQLFTQYQSAATSTAVINLNTGGVVNANNLALGLTAGAAATLNVNGGTLALASAGTRSLSNGGPVTVNLSSGSITDPSYFYLTTAAGQTTTVNQTGGTFNATGTGTDGLFFSTGAGTYNLAGGTLSAVNVGLANTNATQTAGSSFIFNGGTLQVRGTSGMGGGFFTVPSATVGPNGGTIDTNGFNALTSQAIRSGVTGAADGGLAKIGSGLLTFTGASTYTGATTVTGGTLLLGGAGSVNGSGSIVVNGTGAQFVQTSTVASTPAVTLTQGTVDGTGTIGAVTVGAGTGGIVANGNGGTGTLSMNALTFLGAANDNVVLLGGAATTTPGQVVTNALTTPTTAGPVVVNVAAGSLNNGTYDLIQYGSLGGGGFAAFVLGTVTGAGNRQTETLGLVGNDLVLNVNGSLDQYTGANGNGFSNGLGQTNFRLTTTQAPVDFVNGDSVLFDDTANAANTAVNLGNAVAPASTTFNNTSRSYSISSTGGFGIGGTGALTKSGTGTLTLNTANTYTGGTTLNAGTLNLGNAAALSTGPLTINGGTLDNTTGSTVELAGNNVAVNGNFTFAGTSQLNTGSGSVVLSGNRTVTVGGNGLYVNGPISEIGTASLTLAGGGTTTLAAASTFTGGTTVNGGTVNLNAGGGSGTVRGPLTVNAGATVNLNAEDALGFAAGNSVTTLTVNGGTVNFLVAPGNSTDFTRGNQGFITNVVLGGGQILGVAESPDLAAVPGRFNFSPGFGITTTASSATSLITTGIQIRAGATLPINTARGTVAAAGPDLEIDGQITDAEGAGSINKLGPGTLTVTDSFGASTYAGGTTISQGTVRANDVTGNTGKVAVLGTGTTTILANGTLGGDGLTGGDVVVVGTITAGTDANTIGLLTTSGQSWNSSGGYTVKLGSGTSSDELVMTGLTINASSGSPFTILPFFTGTLANGSTYVIADDTDVAGAANPFAAAIGSTLFVSSGAAQPGPGLGFSLDTVADGRSGYDLRLVVGAAVPEPGSLLLLAVAAAPLTLGRRRVAHRQLR